MHSFYRIPDKRQHSLSRVGIANDGTRIIDPESLAVIASRESTEIAHTSRCGPKEGASVGSVSPAGATDGPDSGVVHLPSHATPIWPQRAELNHCVSVIVAGP